MLITITKEPFIPVRLYYDINNVDLLRKALGQLKCVVSRKGEDNYFNIFYQDEAKNLKLNIPYNKVPKKLHPVKLANCVILPAGNLICDVESKIRARGIMNFFNSHIPSSIMEINAAAISNKMITNPEYEPGLGLIVNGDKIFKDDSMYHNYEIMNEEIEDIGTKDSEYSAEKFYIKHNKIPSNESVTWLDIRLGLKEMMIFQRKVGNENCTALDILNKVTANKKNKKSKVENFNRL